jgi:arsenate reductase-like glutaredoxin family protein
MPKLTYEKLIASKEYLLWKDLARVAKEYDITETNLFTMEDLSGIYWEPFFERLYKLGQMMRFTKKLKEIRIDWMRPILYFGARSDGIIEFDGRKDIVDKGAVGDCSVVKYCFKSTINAILSVRDIDEKNFKEKHKEFKKEIKYFFNALNKYVRDGGFYKMHQHVKLILKPLLDLRRAGYRLFSVEKGEENYYDITFFNDTESLKQFIESTKDFFYWEKFIRSKDKDEEKLNKFMERETDQEELKYNFRNDIRKIERPNSVNPYSTNINFNKLERNKEQTGIINDTDKEKAIYNYPKNPGHRASKRISQREREEFLRKQREKRELILPNMKDLIQPEPLKLKKEAYQEQFEKGIEEMMVYLNDKKTKDFPFVIDPHKIFVNIKYIPDGTKKDASNFYLSQLIDEIDTLKRKCYEMKLNGITRILMPITRNLEIIESLKNIFDLHNIIYYMTNICLFMILSIF